MDRDAKEDWMFSILVAADGLAWEKEEVMTVDASRFKGYSGVEAESISIDRPESLAPVEAADAMLMYEKGAEGPNVGVVRGGKISDIRIGRAKMTFRFKETGRIPRSVVHEHASLLDLHSFELNHTHWAIKDGVIPKLIREKIEPLQERYDVALSFAGENREYVEKVAKYLEENGIAVFYDGFEEVKLWGKDLAEHFDHVYRTGAQFCVMFISKHYAEKMWTNHERRSALAAAIEARQEYILPARFDSTEIPGVRPTIGYVNLDGKSPEELGAMIVKKLRG
jgi:hypothetical protein